MKYYSGEPELVYQLREKFPEVRISRNPYTGTISVCHNKTWRSWPYEILAPEQQLDSLSGYIEKHFGIKGIKSKND